jgi:hypothetical protein
MVLYSTRLLQAIKLHAPSATPKQQCAKYIRVYIYRTLLPFSCVNLRLSNRDEEKGMNGESVSLPGQRLEEQEKRNRKKDSIPFCLNRQSKYHIKESDNKTKELS